MRQVRSSTKVSNFNSIKVRLKPNVNLPIPKATAFQFHKGTIKTWWCSVFRFAPTHFNSIKVRLKPVKSKAYTPEDSMGLWVQKYKKIFRKMSMPKNIFFAALRQPAYLWRFQ